MKWNFKRVLLIFGALVLMCSSCRLVGVKIFFSIALVYWAHIIIEWTCGDALTWVDDEDLISMEELKKIARKRLKNQKKEKKHE